MVVYKVKYLMVNVSLKVDVYHNNTCIDLRLNSRFHLKL